MCGPEGSPFGPHATCSGSRLGRSRRPWTDGGHRPVTCRTCCHGRRRGILRLKGLDTSLVLCRHPPQSLKKRRRSVRYDHPFGELLLRRHPASAGSSLYSARFSSIGSRLTLAEKFEDHARRSQGDAAPDLHWSLADRQILAGAACTMPRPAHLRWQTFALEADQPHMLASWTGGGGCATCRPR
jgi:hypothetical protein